MTPIRTRLTHRMRVFFAPTTIPTRLNTWPRYETIGDVSTDATLNDACRQVKLLAEQRSSKEIILSDRSGCRFVLNLCHRRLRTGSTHSPRILCRSISCQFSQTLQSLCRRIQFDWSCHLLVFATSLRSVPAASCSLLRHNPAVATIRR